MTVIIAWLVAPALFVALCVMSHQSSDVHKCPDCGERVRGTYEYATFAGVSKWWFCGNCHVGIPANERGELIVVKGSA